MKRIGFAMLVLRVVACMFLVGTALFAQSVGHRKHYGDCKRCDRRGCGWCAGRVHNQAKGIDLRTGITNEQGSYTFALIPSGNYSLRVEKQGFKRYEQSGIYLQVNEQIAVPITLQLGELSEQVTVTGAAPLVESTSATIRETIDRVRVSELPLNGRNVLQLQVLVPGSVSAGSLDQGANTPGYAVNGGIGGSNMYSLDGG